MSEGFGRWESEAAFESEFRRSGKDRIFNQHIAHRRLELAFCRLWSEFQKPVYVGMERTWEVVKHPIIAIMDRISRAWQTKP